MQSQAPYFVDRAASFSPRDGIRDGDGDGDGDSHSDGDGDGHSHSHSEGGKIAISREKFLLWRRILEISLPRWGYDEGGSGRQA